MFTADEMTIERLARIIVDNDGPYMRTGRDLEKLLARAGWENPPEYDATPKVPWLIEHMIDRNDGGQDIERLVCRVCDPVEYHDGEEVASVFRAALNSVLKAEGMAVLDSGGRPILAEIGSDGMGAVNAEPHDLDERIYRLIKDRTTADLLLHRAAEARICQRSGAHTMAVIAIGSFVEGLLYTMLSERCDDCRNGRFIGSNGEMTSMRQPNLAALIDTAHALEWIQLDAKTFMHTVRNFRNYIHPRLELADNPRFDSDSVGLCWAPVQAMLNDLEYRISTGVSG
ncbi:hypothetical protein [Nocardia stercoris]|uniref:DUF4145 domain-containing protein n=1 Tax=Nocardia stercoris TaxID=2483361 RepID=A0A3M2LCX1_9NOCA|nr:hypothetical protein [Nocardia stercoris]RMI35397.1 hypothetical protein EBN03_03775 [Nocardia stercoris]